MEAQMCKTVRFVVVAITVLLVSCFGPLKSQQTPADIEEGKNIMALDCIRVYADSSGESHLEDVVISLQEMDFAPPAPPLNASEFLPAQKYGLINASPGWYGDWHPAPKRQIMFYLQGEVEAEASDGTILRLGPGDIALVEDTFGKGHRSRVVGDVDVIIAVVQLEN
jgi:hypothetical protein